VGEAFYQMQFDGTIVKKWRTAPLWGLASTAPFGHDGASLSIDQVIRRHGGEALESQKGYLALKSSERKLIIEFLQSLVLYSTESIPCDIDGDGKISEHFMVQGMDTGIERMNPEWMFKVPGKIEGPTQNVKNEKIISYALTNVREAYGQELDMLKDSDNDGFPDVIDPEPLKKGFKDGVNGTEARDR
jgi:hypothetical protein